MQQSHQVEKHMIMLWLQISTFVCRAASLQWQALATCLVMWPSMNGLTKVAFSSWGPPGV